MYENLYSAVERCEGKFVINKQFYNCFHDIYPFTTENISGYINNFDLKNKSLLTVGSSGDQVINAIACGCKDITLIDINPYSKYYFYLKCAAILCLSNFEYLNFFCCRDLIKKDLNKNFFDINVFNNIKHTLRLLDYDSYLFWDELFQSFDKYTIRYQLFSIDEYSMDVIKKCNLYLEDEIYEKLRTKIFKFQLKFINDNLKEINLKNKYDNIWLSNLGMYLSLNEIEKLIHNLNNNLKINGQMLVCYLYKTDKNTKYQENWIEIFNLEKVFEIFKNYNLDLSTFIGLDGLIEEREKKDSVLTYRKTLKKI